MKLPLGWLRDFVDAPEDVRTIAARLAALGFEVASIDGDVIDLEITANRPDCLTIAGLAREVATAFDLPLKTPDGPRAPGPRPEHIPSGEPQAPSLTPHAIPVSLEHEGCGRFALAIIDVTVGPSPTWMADRLAAAGVRPINNVVDITNYVMLEQHPMHAFDAAKLAGPELHVRLARAGEKLTTLDGQTRTLDPSILVVADRDRAVSIAGIMGGASSEVSASTTRIALEAAWWQPALIRGMSRRLGLKTEAAARFERGAAFDGPIHAIQRALELFDAIGAGRPIGTTLDVYPRAAEPATVALRRDHLDRLLGDVVPAAEVERVLSKLGFGVTVTPVGWSVGVPGYRVDVRREADLIEEVGRHWGFDRIPATFPALRSAPRPSNRAIADGRTIRRVLTGAGLQEAATFTFMEQSAAAPFTADPAALVAIANPLSEKSAVLRPSLLPGLLDALTYSRRRETADVRLFEAGSVFSQQGERQTVAWVMTGSRGDHWSAAAESIDFFDAKGVAELVAHAFGRTIETAVADWRWFVPGRAAHVLTAGSDAPRTLGYLGQIRPEIAAARGLGDGGAVVAGEIDLAALFSYAGLAPDGGQTSGERRITPLPRFPSIVRDLSILIDERLPAATVRGTIRTNAPATLVAMREFDRYAGGGIAPGQVSLSIRLTFRAADRTLTDVEVQQAVDAILAVLARDHGAMLRGQGN